MKRILLVGEDFALLATRTALLAKMGASVTCCSSLELRTHVGSARFDLVILCHTLEDSVRCSLAGDVRRRWPNARILQVLTRFDSAAEDYCPAPAGVNAYVPATEPGQFVSLTMQLLEGQP